MAYRASLSVDWVRILLRYASRMGIEPEEVRRSVGLASLPEGMEARVSARRVRAIWEEIARRTRDPNFGLHFGIAAEAPLGGHVLFSVMMNCPTVGDAVDKLARYHGLMADAVRLAIHRRDGLARLTWEPAQPGLSPDRHHSEAIQAMLAVVLRRLTEGEVRLNRACFGHPPPIDTTEHQHFFGCPLLFDQPSNELVLDPSYLSLPILLADPDLLEALERYVQGLLDRLYGPDTWSDRVTRLIGSALSRGDKPTLNAIARDLAVSRRHLQTKLRDEDTTYRALLERVRVELALDHLGRPEVSICDIAFLLGFSEQSSFNHAFRRWTGQTPGAYQKSRAGG
jgi:AraC-like DNA-binding protein